LWHDVTDRREGAVKPQNCIIYALLAAMSLSGPAFAQDPSAGLRIAEAECARCHAVGRQGQSPLAPAPPFREFARKWPIDQGNVGERTSMSHGEMPEFIFEPNEIADLVVYLLTIQEPQEK
jgi:mono/diheme cytochrome c family protein